MRGYLNLLLHQDLSKTFSSSSSNTRTSSPRTTKRTCAIEHSAIQKNSVQCIVGTVDADNVLPSRGCRYNVNNSSGNDSSPFCGLDIFVNTCFLEFNSEPDLILLEDQECETSRCRNCQTNLFLFVKLDVQFRHQ